MTHYAPVRQNGQPVSPPARHVARKVCAGASVAAFGLYLTSPFFTLWTISSSLKKHDMVSLGHVINWGELDSSIKQQALSGFHLTEPASDELPEFGTSFATTVISNAVDTNVTQNNLSTLVDEVIPAALPGDIAKKLSFSDLLGQASFHFERPDLFVTEVRMPGHQNETPLKIEMRIQGWQWKVTSVSFPVPRAPTLTASASANNA